MPVQINLAQLQTYTNLDHVKGDVVLDISNPETISAVDVKLEGIAQTRVPYFDREKGRKKEAIEAHKLLYKTQRVFPTHGTSSGSQSSFTLQRGQHTWPFSLRIPINASCATSGFSLSKLDYSMQGLNVVSEGEQHVKSTLPPSFHGSQVATIRYFIKVTVARPNLLKRNMRAYNPIVLLPIEPPRPPPRDIETYIQRVHRLAGAQPKGIKSLSIFKSTDKNRASIDVKVEARLPAPSILVPGVPLPMRLLFTILSPPSGSDVTVSTFSLYLRAQTSLAAKSHVQNVEGTEKIVENIPVGAQLSSKGTFELDAQTLGVPISLPMSTPPTFVTCNIKRDYSILIVVGLTSPGAPGAVSYAELTTPVDVFSGIVPPKELLQHAHRLDGRLDEAVVPQANDTKSQTDVKSEKEHPPERAKHESNQASTGHDASGSQQHDQQSSTLPTYEEAVEETFQEAVAPQARREYSMDPSYFQNTESLDKEPKDK